MARTKSPKKKVAKKKVTKKKASRRKTTKKTAGKSGEKQGKGRPSDFREAFIEEAYRLCLIHHATDKDLAEYFDKAESTINLWKKEHPAFADAIRTGKKIADGKVAAALLDRATGFTHVTTEQVLPKDASKPVELKKEHYYPPETSAAVKWLNNRQPEFWNDKVQHQHAGPGGGPIPLANMDISEMPAADAAKKYKEFIDAVD